MKSFIETQFPVSKISKESFMERKSVQSQTLTGLGKWWGRKPLVLVRAVILGLLMPSSEDPIKDREIFLKILTMDEEGLWQRKKDNISLKEIYSNSSPRERSQWFSEDSTETKIRYKKGIKKDQKEEIQKIVFSRMSYDKKIKFCYRPEQIEGPTFNSWKEINHHLGTHAESIPELIKELGERKFGHTPRIGDCFCGGGSIPFEASCIGCNSFGSDLNPVACLLTFASLNIIGGNEESIHEIIEIQKEIYSEFCKQLDEWGIEGNNKGWKADAYLYCNETICPECGWKIPLAPSWLVGKTSKVVAKLVPNEETKDYSIEIIPNASTEEMEKAEMSGTIKDSDFICPNPQCQAHITPIPISNIRDNRNLSEMRLWENDDITPRVDDVFQERLFCIKWIEEYTDEKDKKQSRKQYLAPNEYDFINEEKILQLLKDKFEEWQLKGYIPSSKIEMGEKTKELIRTRGWTHWHHLFTPRQLLMHGLLFELFEKKELSDQQKVSMLLVIGASCDFNSKLCRWGVGESRELVAQTFYNQALNTLYVYASGASNLSDNRWFFNLILQPLSGNHLVYSHDSKTTSEFCDVWITDPPYADAINYHELSEFFLAWYGNKIKEIFPTWYSDSKRALAITGSDTEFRNNMVETYKNLASKMSEDGMQVVMFTHKNPAIWADLALILWASGLQVTAAWCISTETEAAGIKKGNYVKGTVTLILRKQSSDEIAFLDEIYHEVEFEVINQLKEMLALENKEDPNFGDTDYQLAAYAAALRVITKYKAIEEIDVYKDLLKVRRKGEKNPLEEVIENAVKIACDYLVPDGIEKPTWKQLNPEERFYLKGLELENHGEYRNGAYQDLARGFGIKEYTSLLANRKANQTRLKTASEFKNKNLGKDSFGCSIVRQVLFAIYETIKNDDTSAGKKWLRAEINHEYWNKRELIIAILKYLSKLEMNSIMVHWKDDAKTAKLLAVAIENDHV